MPISDKWLFLIFYPLCAIATIHIGNDNSLLELLDIPSYYSDLIIAFGISYSSGLYIRFISNRIKNIHTVRTKSKVWLHFFYGVLPPLSFAIVLEVAYLRSLEISIQESSIFYLEAPLIFLFLIFSNSFYFFREIYAVQRQKLLELRSVSTKSKNYKTHIVVYKGVSSRVVETNDISLIEFSDKVTYLVTSNGEKYVMRDTLQSIYDGLDPHQFYMLNRQVITNKNNVIGYEQTETRKLRIKLRLESIEDTFVSKARAGEFIRWLKSAQ
jgi:hypothetical protein